MSIQRLNFISRYLGGNTNVVITLPYDIVPADYRGDDIRYPVLWLLHGGMGDAFDWCRNTNIERYAKERGLAVVMPSGMNSGYANWSNEEGFFEYNMYDYLFEELMPLVYNWFPISDKKEDNFVSGLSMGGEGALIYALGRPDRFAASAVLSVAPLDSHLPYDEIFPNPTGCKMRKAHDRGEYDKFLNSYENVWDNIAKLAGDPECPRFLFGIGTKDIGYQGWLKTRDYAKKVGFNGIFEEFEGYEHTWPFWDMYIQRALDFFGLERR